jgi:ABC-type nitrate/sulfonate/bicarbonate transport system substrate-binding protein
MSKKIYRYSVFMLVLLLAAFLIAGCDSDDGDDNEDNETSNNNAPLTNVKLQINWTHEYSSGGFYASVKSGHFRNQGLEVELIEGGFTAEGAFIDPITEVLEGRADFALVDTANLLLARSQGKSVVAIFAVLQRSPTAVISISSEGLASPADLVGKTVLVSPDAQPPFRAVLATQGVDPAEVNVQDRTSFGIDPLLNGEADALSGWVINEGVAVQEAGFEANFIINSDYGINNYDFLIFTTEQTLTDKPEVVEKLLRGVIDGWREVIEDPDKVIGYVLEYKADLDRDQQSRRLNAMIPLISPPGTQMGMMQPEVWELSQSFLVEQGDLTAPLDLSAAYNLTFLNKIYGNN